MELMKPWDTVIAMSKLSSDCRPDIITSTSSGVAGRISRLGTSAFLAAVILCRLWPRLPSLAACRSICEVIARNSSVSWVSSSTVFSAA